MPNFFSKISSKSLRLEEFVTILDFFGFLNNLTRFSDCLTESFFSIIFLANK